LAGSERKTIVSTATLEQPATPAQSQPVVRQAIPATAYGVMWWQLDAWCRAEHPSILKFEVVRGGDFGGYDGYIHPADAQSTAYALGWFNGRRSVHRNRAKNSEHA